MDEHHQASTKKACWIITTGRHTFPMLGAVLNHEEALAAARVIWPDAEVA